MSRHKLRNERHRRWLEKGLEMSHQKKIAYETPVHARADALLAEIGAAIKAHEALAAEAQAALEELGKEWAARLAPLKEQVTLLDAEIKALAKDRRAVIFGAIGPGPGQYQAVLPHGYLLCARKLQVVRPRKVDVLALLERYGFEEAIKRSAAVDWEELDKWDDDALGIVGTCKEPKELYTYEVKK